MKLDNQQLDNILTSLFLTYLTLKKEFRLNHIYKSLQVNLFI